MKGDNINILKKSIRQRRAISSCLYENGSYNYSEEEKNKSKNSIKSFHRKTTSSYFCGSYLSSNLEDDLINNINIDQYLEKNKKEEKKEKKNILVLNRDNNLDIFDNLSFHSYDSDNNKIEEEDSTKKKKIVKESEKVNKNNNFVNFKNNLKNIKDKNERATKSYLLALGMTNYQNRKEQYVPTVSVIEEEKSDVIDSKSEFSNKKKKINDKYFFLNSFLNKDNLFFFRKENKLKIKSILEKKNKCGLKNKIKEENKNNTPKEKENQVIKLSCALNEIIIKNNIKEENKRKHLKKNKTLILNSFFNNGIKNTNEIMNKKINIESERKKNIFKNTENIGDTLIEKFRNKMGKQFQLFIKEKIRNSYVSNFIKRRYNTENNVNKDKKSFKNKILENKEKVKSNQMNKKDDNTKTIKYNSNFESTINSNLDINNNGYTIKKNENQVNYKFKSNIPIITRIEYRPWSKIPHLRQKIIERKEINSVSNINTNNSNNTNNNNNTSNKNSAPNRKYISKYKNIPYKKNYSFTKDKRENKKDNKDNSKSMKQIKSINEALEIIRIERIKSKNKEKPSLKILNDSNNIKKKHNKSSSYISKNFNSKSSRDKEKNNKVTIKKANSGTFRNDITLKLIEEKTIKLSGNKKSSINVLNKYLKYEKKYNKINVLNQIEKTFDSEKSFFIIICEKITVLKIENSIQNKDIFIFKSILKYYKNQNRFIKIYGNENEPNVISIKNINTNKFNIYSVSMKNELFCLVPINELIFDCNAIILCKK